MAQVTELGEEPSQHIGGLLACLACVSRAQHIQQLSWGSADLQWGGGQIVI